jgi:beta-lactamase superfamily II metal-dependent hydrolase
MKKKLLIGLALLVVIVTVVIIRIITSPQQQVVSAEFAVSNLNVTPTEVKIGDTVTVTAHIRNIGEEKGTQELGLIINGIVEQSENLTLDPGASTSISFFVKKDTEGSYSAELCGLKGTFVVVKSGPTSQSGNLTVHFIDVGQGDSILLDLGDTEVLIDGGDKSPGVVSYISHYVDGPLEVMVATHPHADHIGGLIGVLDAFKVDEIWLNGDTSTSQTYSQFISAVNSEGAEVHVARRGDTIQASNLTFNVLSPVNLDSDTNDNSIVLSLSYGQVDFLFTGDAQMAAEASMLAAGIVPDVDILKVGHHGSRTASSIQFLQAAKPEVAIYMAGKGNIYGHPHQETINNLCEIGAEIYGTDIHGTITVTTDGVTYSVLPANTVPPVACPTVTLHNTTISVNGQENCQ